jgi:hypothetical protein
MDDERRKKALLMANAIMNSGEAPLSFLFDDQFTTADAAPIDIPRVAEPGPGTWNTLVDTGNRLSISGGNLVSASGGTASDPVMYTLTQITRATGTALMWRALSLNLTNALSVAFRAFRDAGDAFNINIGAMPVSNTAFRNYNSSSASTYQITVPSMAGADVAVYTILRSAGYWGVYRQAGAYYLLFVHNSVTTSNLPIQVNALTAATIAEIRAAQLGAPWTNDDNLLTYRVVSPSSGAIQTSEADAIHYVTWTPVAGETLNLIFRRTDDSNYWTARVSESGNTIKVIEVNGGVETERASAAVTINAGTTYRVVCRASGTYINATSSSTTSTASYTSATFNQTATGTKITISGAGTISNWEAWRVNLDAASISELDKL